MVDVVCLSCRISVQFSDICDDADDIGKRKRRIREVFLGDAEAETAIEMEAADAREIVAFGAEDRCDVVAGGLGRRDVAVAKAAVYLDKSVFRRLCVVVLEGLCDGVF